MRAALYIDCDSIEAKAVPVIYEDIIRTDKLVICKMFNSDRDDDRFVESAGRFRIQDCMHGEYKVSSAMVALAVEVMADAALSKPERIYIATGDSLTAPLLDKLRLTDIEVVVAGPCDADKILVNSAQRYMYIDVLAGGKCTADIPDIGDIAKEIYSVSSYYKGQGRDAVMEQVYEGVVRRYPDFDVRNYGYTHLDTFVENNVSGVKVYTDENGVTKLTLVDDREEIDTFAYEYMTGRGYKIDDMAELLDAIRSRFPGFAMENYGYHTDYGFILSFSKFEIWENKGIKIPVKKIQKNIKKLKKPLDLKKSLVYNQTCCGMIAEKRRLLRTYMTQVFRGANVNLQNWRQVTVQYNRLSRGQKRRDGSGF